MLGIGERRVLRLDGRNQAVEQIALEPREAGGVFRCEDIAGRNAVVRQRPTVGHDNDHRHCFSVDDQIVNDRIGMDVTPPLVMVAADPVQQVEHWILLPRRIAGGQVDVGLAPRTGDGGVVFKQLHAAAQGAGTRGLETGGRLGKHADIVGAEHDGPSNVGVGALGRDLFGFFLGRRGGGGQ